MLSLEYVCTKKYNTVDVKRKLSELFDLMRETHPEARVINQHASRTLEFPNGCVIHVGGLGEKKMLLLDVPLGDRFFTLYQVEIMPTSSPLSNFSIHTRGHYLPLSTSAVPEEVKEEAWGVQKQLAFAVLDLVVKEACEKREEMKN